MHSTERPKSTRGGREGGGVESEQGIVKSSVRLIDVVSLQNIVDSLLVITTFSTQSSGLDVNHCYHSVYLSYLPADERLVLYTRNAMVDTEFKGYSFKCQPLASGQLQSFQIHFGMHRCDLWPCGYVGIQIAER